MSEQSLWSKERRSPASEAPATDLRTAFERDYDRLLFSTPVRRLADKTQVFPLDRNDSVRTRLTHSHEVSNLARSIGNRLLRKRSDAFGDDPAAAGAPVILAAVGLAHDLGNPPFGHQGETVIGSWFAEHPAYFTPEGFEPVPEVLRNDFIKFEGNAQTLRLVTRLQVSVGNVGLDLTAATLAALMKYTVPSGKAKELPGAAAKKFGYFESDAEVVDWIRSCTGLQIGQRHPLAWLMEACDDIAYSVLDVEDAIKKGLVSPEDLLSYLRRHLKGENGRQLISRLERDFANADAHDPPPARGREIKTAYFRTRLIEWLLVGASEAFISNRDAILATTQEQPLLESGTEQSQLYDVLKEFARHYAYNSPGVLRIEWDGAEVLYKLMDDLWFSICDREKPENLSSRRKTAKGAYIYSLISDNYRLEFETNPPKGQDGKALPVRYREMQLLTDMMSGMTDSFAVELCKSLRSGHDG